MTEPGLSTRLAGLVARVTWRALAAYAAVTVLATLAVSELAVRQSVRYTADVVESLLGLYADPDGERTTAAPGMLADQLIGLRGRVAITRTAADRAGSRRVYYLSPDMPAKELASLSSDRSLGDVQDEILHALRSGHWFAHGYRRTTGDFGITVVASRAPYAWGPLGVALAAVLGLPFVGLLARRRARRAVLEGLAPLDRMRTALAAIGPASLDQRVATPTGMAELTEVADAVNTLLARVDRSQQALTGFTANASHELRTPLTHIRAQAQWALDGERSAADCLEALAAIALEAERMRRMVEDLLLLARGENRDLIVRRDAFPPARVVEEVLEITGTMLAGKPVVVRAEGDHAAVALGDPERTRQILLNLASNAARHTHVGEIRFTTQIEATRVRIQVHDTGAGIPSEHLPHVFERFYRADIGRSREQGGTGLGLAIATMLAELQGGRLTGTSEMGAGSTFTLELPAAV